MNDFFFADFNPALRFDKDRPGSRDWYRLMHHLGSGAADVTALQQQICGALEAVDGRATFRFDRWERPSGGSCWPRPCCMTSDTGPLQCRQWYRVSTPQRLLYADLI